MVVEDGTLATLKIGARRLVPAFRCNCRKSVNRPHYAMGARHTLATEL
jgi:hypothetical protein